MSRSIIIIFTLCLCIAITFAADLKQLTAQRAAATGSYREPPKGNSAGKLGSSKDQETASSFYGVGFYGPGYGGFGYPFGGYGGYGGYGGFGFPFGGYGGYGGYGGFFG